MVNYPDGPDKQNIASNHFSISLGAKEKQFFLGTTIFSPFLRWTSLAIHQSKHVLVGQRTGSLKWFHEVPILYAWLINIKVNLQSSPGLLVRSAYQRINFLISQPNHMLWVLKRTVPLKPPGL